MRLRGFIIVELLVALLIMGLLIAAAAVSITTARVTARDGTRLGDGLLIASALDQAASVNRGRFPNRASGGSASVMCAHEMASEANPQGINLSLFTNREIPRDPGAVTPTTSGCADYRNGYTYHNNYGPSLATSNNLNFVIEIGLEREKASDELAYQDGSGLGVSPVTSPRFRYFLTGGYCGTNCY